MGKNLIQLCFALLLGASNAWGQLSFEDISATAGVDSVGIARGISFADYDNDGDQDIFVCYSTNTANRMFRNNGNLTFTDVSEETGLNDEGSGNSSCWGDFDNDGWIDCYVSFMGDPNILHRNNGDGTFTDVTVEMGVEDDALTRSVLWADFDQDGWLDLYSQNISTQNHHWRNNGGTSFTDVTFATGSNDNLVAQGGVAYDYDNDSDLDLYLVHDANQDCIMFENDGTGNFADVAPAIGLDFEANGMGVDFADINNDGWFDVYVTNLGVNGLFVHQQDELAWEFETFDAGPEGNGMSWGTFFFDADNDGFEDIYVSNDSFFAPQPNFLYQNNGDLTYTDVELDNGMTGFNASWGSATADLNQDGLPEVFVANANEVGNQLFLNTTENPGNWVGFKLEGVESNRSAIGSRVTVYTPGMMRMDEITAGSSWASQHSLWLTIGIGQETQIDSVEVRWPNGQTETTTYVDINQYHSWQEGILPEPPPPVDPVETLTDGQFDGGQSADDGKVEEESVGIAEAHLDQVTLAPNPARSQVVLNGVRTGDVVTVLRLDGSTLWQGKARTSVHLLNAEDWPAGVYLLRVQSGEASRVLRLIKA